MKTEKIPGELHRLIMEAGIPIHGVGVPTLDKSTWRVDFTDEATGQQQAQAAGILAGFDPEARTRDEVVLGEFISRWRASQFYKKTPGEVYSVVEQRIEDANTAAEMKQILLFLLPALAAGLAYLFANEE